MSVRRASARSRPAHRLSAMQTASAARVAAGRVAHDADQARAEGVGELADAGREPDQHAEGGGSELALDDQRGEGDDVADREAVDGAGSQQRRGILSSASSRPARRPGSRATGRLAMRWLMPVGELPSTRRPTMAMAVVMATAMPAA